MKILDTSFLIHLQREWVRGVTGPARRYLELGAGEEYAVSTVTVLEFLEGYRQPGDAERFLDPFPQLEVNSAVARVGSRIRRNLRERGEPIGDFDVLIAATALATGLPLVTDNITHFQRVEGLVLDRYQ
ncbi:MAG: type II toxin-antitoxin system VapC family toxin [Verrucomicrobiae bacterium]|nr:type II toxin-antitoxin system VapC family toxin [Verrucomicrobiae bacterium]MCP5522737.1 type II toxin-antitoxin system VapC family toxin [Verrucomicrobiales bacterium]